VAANPTLVRVGRAIQRLRTEAQITQAKVAERADLAVETVSRLESGKVDISILRLERIAMRGLKVPLTALFDPPARSRRAEMKASLKRVMTLLEDLPDDDLDDLYHVLNRILALRGRRSARKGVLGDQG
jgi:transcriptional regulator with XRE-family HTH domain